MSILLVGARGNMGQRYASILRYLGRPFVAVDIENSERYISEKAAQADGILIATPTSTHVKMIRRFLPYRRPVLCEKPITKDIQEFRGIMAEIKGAKTPFRMVNQYRMLAEPLSVGPTVYDYFKHGSDGLFWDCLQIIGLARGDCRVAGKSPIWTCVLNGKCVRLSDMDAAYVAYLQEWFKAPAQEPGQIIEAHEKTAEMERNSRDG